MFLWGSNSRKVIMSSILTVELVYLLELFLTDLLAKIHENA